MWLLDVLRYRWRVLTHPRAHEQEVAEELAFHVGLEAMQREHAGRGELSSREARFAARRRFGNVTYDQEEARRVSGLAFIDTVIQDIRFALRSFRRTPMFTAVTVVTLAVGILPRPSLSHGAHSSGARRTSHLSPLCLQHVIHTIDDILPVRAGDGAL